MNSMTKTLAWSKNTSETSNLFSLLILFLSTILIIK